MRSKKLVSPLDRDTGVIMSLRCIAVAVTLCAMPTIASAADSEPSPGIAPKTPWYVVGQVEYHSPRRDAVGARDDGLRIDDLMSRRLSIDFTYGGAHQPTILSITDGVRPRSATTGRETGGYELMFTGTYGVSTGTAITPRITAGVGMASRPDGSSLGVPSRDPSRAEDLAPALELGLGADYAVTDNWGFSAEYRAFYHGGSDTETGPVDPQVSQQFTLGAKIRF